MVAKVPLPDIVCIYIFFKNISSTLHTVLFCSVLIMSFPIDRDNLKLFNLSRQCLLVLLSLCVQNQLLMNSTRLNLNLISAC